MNIIALDNDTSTLFSLVRILKKIVPAAKVFPFRESGNALAFARENRVNVAFVEVGRDAAPSITLSNQLSEIHSDINIIFMVNGAECPLEIYEVHSSGLIVKPLDDKQVADEIMYLRFPVDK